MSNFLVKVNNFINDNQMLNKGERLVIGLSGGADSVCLLYVLVNLADKYDYSRKDIFAVHINHRIRGAEADGDQTFAEELCNKLGVNFICFKKDIIAYAKELSLTVEEAGRKYRYDCFEKVALENNCTKIAVAHNKNDLAETVIFNMLRGSGLKGMSGMLPVRDKVIRPILNVTRKEILDYLCENNQDYRTDSTNEGIDYDRNKIRHIILPAMEEINSGAVGHICQMAEEAKNSYKYIHNKALESYDGLSEADDFGKTISLDINMLYKSSPVLQEHLIHEAIGDVADGKKDITRKHIMAVVGLIYQDTGKIVELPYNIRARRSYDRLIITDKKQDVLDYNIEIKGEGNYEIPGWGSIEFKIIDNTSDIEIPKKIYTKMLDYGKIKDKLCIRTPEDGDYVTFNLEGSVKKLSRIFIDNKIDREDRANWPVLACGNHIVWVLGVRFNEAFRIDENTKEILYMNYIRKEV